VSALDKSQLWLQDLNRFLAGLKGFDGQLDGLWTCRRGSQVIIYNSKDKPIETFINGKTVLVPPYAIWN
jgi:hypothetical protein